jgi:hypothetical protein
MQISEIVLNGRVGCNEDMALLIILAVAALAAIAGTVVVASRDGYRQVPTRRA